MIRGFLHLGRLEGISLLLLLFIAMPLKYGMDMPEMVRWIGSIHGGLFVAYIGWAAVLAVKLKWTFTTLFLCGILSSVPFGTFYFERKYLFRNKTPSSTAPKPNT